MPRQSDPTQYIRAEKPCRKCGTIWRHPDRLKTCVECARRRNARKYAERKAPQRAKYGNDKRTPQMGGATLPAHRSFAEINLGFKIASYHSSPTAIERSRHLDKLIQVGGGKEEQDAPLTAGDLHRASLRVGATQRDTSADYPKLKAQRAAENDALAAAIEKIRPTLADLVTVDDVLAAVPPEAAPMMPSRRGYAASVAMTRLGILKVHPERRGRHRIFAVRDLARYRAMRQVDLAVLHAEMHGRPPPTPRITRKMALASGAYSYQREFACSRCGGHEYRTATCRCTRCPPPVTTRTGSARAAALAAGERTYTGTACPRCGGTLRRTANYDCLTCARRRRRATQKPAERAAGQGVQSRRPAGASAWARGSVKPTRPFEPTYQAPFRVSRSAH